jgi:hypothetical protein
MSNEEVKQYILQYDDKFRSFVSVFMKDHPIFTYKFAIICAIWVIICISAISMMSIVGMGYADKQMQNHHENGIFDDSYNSWNNIVKPIFPYMLNTLQFLALLVMVLPIYVLIRYTLVNYF